MARSIRVRRGFTLVEMLVVIAIIGILIGLLLPAVQAVRESGNRARCSNNVKQIGLALQGYVGQQKTFPTNWGTGSETGDQNTTGHSWLSMILPYLEADVLYSNIGFGKTLANNLVPARMSVPMFICPSDSADGLSTTQMLLTGQTPGVGTTNYKACAGGNWNGTTTGLFKRSKSAPDYVGKGNPADGTPGDKNAPTFGGRNAGTPPSGVDYRDYGDGVICRGLHVLNDTTRRLYPTSAMEVRDGLSQTFALGESVPAFCPWSAWYWWNGATATCGIPLNWENPTKPRRTNVLAPSFADNSCFMSRHPNGGVFGLCDGSVRFVNNNVDLNFYRATATIDGGELVQTPPDW